MTAWAIRPNWPPALDTLRARATTDPGCLRELVQALDSVGLDEEAWSAAAHPQQMGPHLLQSLIEQREAGHRADMPAPFRYLIQAQFADTSKYRYDRAVKRLRRSRAVHADAGDPEGFIRFLDELRTEHKRMTSFITNPDQAGLTLD